MTEAFVSVSDLSRSRRSYWLKTARSVHSRIGQSCELFYAPPCYTGWWQRSGWRRLSPWGRLISPLTPYLSLCDQQTEITSRVLTGPPLHRIEAKRQPSPLLQTARVVMLYELPPCLAWRLSFLNNVKYNAFVGSNKRYSYLLDVSQDFRVYATVVDDFRSNLDFLPSRCRQDVCTTQRKGCIFLQAFQSSDSSDSSKPILIPGDGRSAVCTSGGGVGGDPERCMSSSIC